MAATTNGARIAQIGRATETFEEVRGSFSQAQSNFLDELPGAVFAVLTLAYIVTSLLALI